MPRLPSRSDAQMLCHARYADIIVAVRSRRREDVHTTRR